MLDKTVSFRAFGLVPLFNDEIYHVSIVHLVSVFIPVAHSMAAGSSQALRQLVNAA